MTLLLIMIIVILATPKEEVSPKAQPMKSCIDMLREQPYLTGINQSEDDEN